MAWRSAAATAAWVCVLAGAGGLGAWSLAHTGPGDDRTAHAAPLDDDVVRRKLAAARAAASHPGTTATPSPTPSSPAPTAPTVTLRVTGGSITAQCRPGGRVYLTAWSPAAGYHVDDDVVRGPARTATLEFEPAGDGEDRPYALGCTGGRPAADAVADQDGPDDADGADEADD